MGLSRFSIVALLVLAICTASAAAYAVAAPPSTDGWTLTPIVSGSSVTFVLGIDNMSAMTGYDGKVTKTWGDPTLTDPTKFMSLGDGGVLQSLTVSVDGDPGVSLEFDYRAGTSGNDFSLLSDLVTFDTINPARGTATAGITVTDRDGNGATATGAIDGKMYVATYGQLPASGPVPFSTLVSGPVTSSAYRSATKSETTDPIWQNISGAVSHIQSQFAFHLSPNDSASGTSYFQVEPVPEPASLVAMLTGCIGLLGLVRRRRS